MIVLLFFLTIMNCQAQEKDEQYEKLKREKFERQKIQDEKDQEAFDKINEQVNKARIEPRISGKYYRGSFLIYDCEAKHFACVNDVSVDLCKNRRDKALAEKKSNLPCAPLKEFESQDKCGEIHYEHMYDIKKKHFCFNYYLF